MASWEEKKITAALQTEHLELLCQIEIIYFTFLSRAALQLWCLSWKALGADKNWQFCFGGVWGFPWSPRVSTGTLGNFSQHLYSLWAQGWAAVGAACIGCENGMGWWLWHSCDTEGVKAQGMFRSWCWPGTEPPEPAEGESQQSYAHTSTGKDWTFAAGNLLMFSSIEHPSSKLVLHNSLNKKF